MTVFIEYIKAKQRESARERSYDIYTAEALRAISNRASIKMSLNEFRHPRPKETLDAVELGVQILTRAGCKEVGA